MAHKVLSCFSKPFLFAHRGASSLAPENTLASFRKALECGCKGIELDIHRCKSGELVVIHDFSLKRTGRFHTAVTNDVTVGPDLLVEKTSLTELREYDFGIWFSQEFRGEKIPTLCEVFEILPDDICVDIEIKAETASCYDISKDLAVFLYEYNKVKSLTNRILVSSFNPIALRFFKNEYTRVAGKKTERIATALIYSIDKSVPFYLRKGQGRVLCNPDILKPDRRNVEHIKDLKGKGLFKKMPYFIWTVDEKDEAKKLLERGATALISNCPQKLLSLFSELKKKKIEEMV